MIRRCVFCGDPVPTSYAHNVCSDHTDLLDLDPGAPAALDEARVPSPRAELAAELAPPALASSSAAKSAQESDWTNGDGPSGAAALDKSETP